MIRKFAGALALITVITGLLVNATKADRLTPEPQQNDREAVRKALVEGGLHAAAKASGGHYRAVVITHWDATIPDLTALAQLSDVAIIGQVWDNRSHLSVDAKKLTSDYRVQVLEVLGGKTKRPLEEIVLAMPGGRIEFSDGTSAEQLPKGFVFPKRGGRYLIFLQEAPPSSVSTAQAEWAQFTQGVFFATTGPTGMYELGADDKVTPSTRKADPVATKARRKSAKELIHDARAALKDVGKNAK